MVASIEQYASEFEPPYRPPLRTQADLNPAKCWGGWTMLDQQIALAKGWEYDPMEHGWWMSPEDKAAGRYWFGGLTWASEDSKALELVDELAAKGCWMDFSYSPSAKQWYIQVQWEGESPRFHAWADTRPEAICRAYLAAVEWMKARKG